MILVCVCFVLFGFFGLKVCLVGGLDVFGCRVAIDFWLLLVFAWMLCFCVCFAFVWFSFIS